MWETILWASLCKLLGTIHKVQMAAYNSTAFAAFVCENIPSVPDVPPPLHHFLCYLLKISLLLF